jgi:hypothetical protein
MQVPVVVTLNSPTHLAVELAREWDITLIGYTRGPKMHVYTGWQHLCVASAVGNRKGVSLIPAANGKNAEPGK